VWTETVKDEEQICKEKSATEMSVWVWEGLSLLLKSHNLYLYVITLSLLSHCTNIKKLCCFLLHDTLKIFSSTTSLPPTTWIAINYSEFQFFKNGIPTNVITITINATFCEQSTMLHYTLSPDITKLKTQWLVEGQFDSCTIQICKTFQDIYTIISNWDRWWPTATTKNKYFAQYCHLLTDK
jgi:hypothetical protein